MDYKSADKWTNEEIKELSILLSHSSCAMEGNTLTLGETRDLLINNNVDYFKLKKLREIFEIKNLDNTIDYIFDNYKSLVINNETIKKLHKLIMQNIIINNGYFRDHNVRINESNVLPYDWTVVEYKLIKLNVWYNNEIKASKTKEEKESIIYEYHAKFEKIHPFNDGNGRTGRILILLMQLQNNLNIKYVDVNGRKLYINGLEEYNLTGKLDKLNSIFKEFKITNKSED